MEFCKFCVVAPYNDFCRCQVDNDLCPFVYRCTVEMRWKPLDGMDKCTNRVKEETLAKDEYRVRFALKGRLFVEIDDFVKEVPNPFDSVPQKVKLVWVDGQPYIKGWEPKPKKKAVKKDGEAEK